MPKPPPHHDLAKRRSLPRPAHLHLLALPSEILDEILALLKHPHDLLALALVSHALHALVVPAHLHYRVLRLRKPHPEIWAHLAKRKDLARNIWKIVLCSPRDYSQPDIHPKGDIVMEGLEGWTAPPMPMTPASPMDDKRLSWRTSAGSLYSVPDTPSTMAFPSPSPMPTPITPSFPFTDSPISPITRAFGGMTTSASSPAVLASPGLGYAQSVGYEDYRDAERLRVSNLCQALRNMPYLEEFVWGNLHNSIDRPCERPVYEDMILSVLAGKQSLKRLSLSGGFGRHVVGESESLAYPGWKFKDLDALSLNGDVWTKPSNATHVRHLLSNSPNLTALEIPMELPFLPTLRFPHLRQLHLFLNSGGAARDIDLACSRFLAAHPTIEHLRYFPIEELRVRPSWEVAARVGLERVVEDGLDGPRPGPGSGGEGEDGAATLTLPLPPLHPFAGAHSKYVAEGLQDAFSTATRRRFQPATVRYNPEPPPPAGAAGAHTLPLLSSSSLPNLKRLVSNWQFYRFLSCARVKRARRPDANVGDAEDVSPGPVAVKRRIEYLDLEMMSPEDLVALGVGFGPRKLPGWGRRRRGGESDSDSEDEDEGREGGEVEDRLGIDRTALKGVRIYKMKGWRGGNPQSPLYNYRYREGEQSRGSSTGRGKGKSRDRVLSEWTWRWNETRVVGGAAHAAGGSGGRDGALRIGFGEVDEWEGMKGLEVMGRVFPNLRWLECPEDVIRYDTFWEGGNEDGLQEGEESQGGDVPVPEHKSKDRELKKLREVVSPSLDQWLHVLSQFPNLEVFHGMGIWRSVDGDKTEMHGAIERLVGVCPKLKELDHCDVHSRMQKRRRIVIFRERGQEGVEEKGKGKERECENGDVPSPGERNQVVDYTSKRPRSRIGFDVLGDHFQ
ncbi:hypothetical protein AX16_009176 [Volvariella volvacea WC 439]|nr:hypothetical protein AX16_009176 [Volvariella volvacea WC 439]